MGIKGDFSPFKLTAKAPENKPSQKGNWYSNHPFSGAKMLLSRRVTESLRCCLTSLSDWELNGSPRGYPLVDTCHHHNYHEDYVFFVPCDFSWILRVNP